ncbi:hypothetical protein OHU07_43755 [Streptomyces phaeochromogenes]
MAIMVNRAVLEHRLFTGLSLRHLAGLIEELMQILETVLISRRSAG